MNRRTVVLTVAAVVAFASLFWLWAWLGFPTEGYVCTENKHTGHENCAAYYPISYVFFWVYKYNEPLIAIGTLLLAGFVTIQIVDARKSSERQLRAYVMIDKAAISSFMVGKQGKAKLLLRNFGQTPAHDVQQWVAAGISPYPISDAELKRIKDDPIEMTPKPIAPNGEFNVWAEAEEVTEAAYKAVRKDSTHAFFVVGEIRYRDAFGVNRETDFVLFSGGPLGAEEGLAPYFKGNRIT